MATKLVESWNDNHPGFLFLIAKRIFHVVNQLDGELFESMHIDTFLGINRLHNSENDFGQREKLPVVIPIFSVQYEGAYLISVLLAKETISEWTTVSIAS